MSIFIKSLFRGSFLELSFGCRFMYSFILSLNVALREKCYITNVCHHYELSGFKQLVIDNKDDYLLKYNLKIEYANNVLDQQNNKIHFKNNNAYSISMMNIIILAKIKKIDYFVLNLLGIEPSIMSNIFLSVCIKQLNLRPDLTIFTHKSRNYL